MDYERFDWDSWDDENGNVQHILRSGAQPVEAEEALLDPARIGTDAYNTAGERRWAYLGATEGGRVLFVVFTRRRGKVRVVTARQATARETRRYRRRGK